MAESSRNVSRRGLVGAGAALAASGAAALNATSAQAASLSAIDRRPSSQASPIASTIASPRQNYVVYRTVGEFDFSVETETANRKFGGYGVYPTVSPSSLWASIDIPAAVTLKDIEFYAYNSGATNVYAGVWLWSADSGYFSAQLASITIPPGTKVEAIRAEFASANTGPYPTGTKVFLTIYGTTDGKVQINGARLGMLGGGNVSLSLVPQRGYDSRDSSKFAADETRRVTLTPEIAPSGTVGVLAQVTVLEASSAGYVMLYPATEDRPAIGRLFHPASSPIVFNVPVPVTVSRRFRVYSQRAAHIVVDVVGTIS